MQMSDPVSLVVTAVALTISVFSSYVAWVSLKIARQATRPGFIQNLFLANQSAMQYPELLVDVHGIDPTTSPREARALVYLNVVLDGFVTAAEIDYRGDFAKMARDLKLHGGSLRRFLARPENAARWAIVKSRSFGDFAPGFIAAVDELIAHEQRLTGGPSGA